MIQWFLLFSWSTVQMFWRYSATNVLLVSIYYSKKYFGTKVLFACVSLPPLPLLLPLPSSSYNTMQLKVLYVYHIILLQEEVHCTTAKLKKAATQITSLSCHSQGILNNVKRSSGSNSGRIRAGTSMYKYIFTIHHDVLVFFHFYSCLGGPMLSLSQIFCRTRVNYALFPLFRRQWIMF